MNIIFITLSIIKDVNVKGIYTDLIRKFRDEGHKVFVVCPFERKYKLKTSLLEQDGVHILGVRTLNIQKTKFIEKGIGTLLMEYQFIIEIRKYLKDVSFDLILYSTPPINITRLIKSLRKGNVSAVTYLLLKDLSPQDFLDLNVLSSNNIIYKYLRKVEKKLLMLSDYIGCMSPENRNYILRENSFILPQNVEVAPNSLDMDNVDVVDKSASSRSQYGIPEDALVFIYGGNIGIAQGVDFIKLCLDYYKNDRRVFFVIVGGGTDFHKLVSWYKCANCPSNIKILEFMPKEKYDQVQSICDVGLIFLDHRFTFPNYPSRLLSYLSSKKPILAATDKVSDVGSIAVENNYGLWCESNDVDSFVMCVEKYLNLSETERKIMGQNGYEFLLNNYLVQHTYDKIISHF